MKIKNTPRPLGLPLLMLFAALVSFGCSKNASDGSAPINREMVQAPVDPKALVTPIPIENASQISLENFDRIKNGMTLQEVELIILGDSRLMTSKRDNDKLNETYRWETADASRYIEVSLTNDKVVGKNQKGLK